MYIINININKKMNKTIKYFKTQKHKLINNNKNNNNKNLMNLEKKNIQLLNKHENCKKKNAITFIKIK